MNEIIKRYDAGDITIVWKPAKCIHAAECVKALPSVYQPNNKPWISPNNATAHELRAQIKTCPSGALTFEENTKSLQPDNNEKSSIVTQIEVKPNGPLLCHGSVSIRNVTGEIEVKEKVTALCRCGASHNKPYCDGSHVKIAFKG